MDIGWELVKGALYGFDYDFDRNPYGEESWARLGNRDGLYENYKDADGNTIRTSELILQVFCMAASAPLEGIGLADDLVRGASWLGRTSQTARTGAGIVKETCEFGKRVAKKSAKAVKKAAKRPLRLAKDAAESIAKRGDGIPETGIPRFDALAVNSPHFSRFQRLVEEQGFNVRGSTLFTDARAQFQRSSNRFIYNPERMTVLDMMHEIKHIQQFQRTGGPKPWWGNPVTEIEAYNFERFLLRNQVGVNPEYLNYLNGMPK